MSYETAPATRMLSTRCCACSRPLVDAASVEAGMGPHCRKKYNYDQIPESVRKAANALIHEAALKSTTSARREEIAQELGAMGAETLKEKILTRFCKPRVLIALVEDVTFGKGKWEERRPAYTFRTPFNARFNDDFKDAVSWKRRTVIKNKTTGKFECWAIHTSEMDRLWKLMGKHFRGEPGLYTEGDDVTPFRVAPGDFAYEVSRTPFAEATAPTPTPTQEEDTPTLTVSVEEVAAPAEAEQLTFPDWATSLSL